MRAHGLEYRVSQILVIADGHCHPRVEVEGQPGSVRFGRIGEDHPARIAAVPQMGVLVEGLRDNSLTGVAVRARWR